MSALVTIIKFVGLLVITQATDQSAQVVLGQVPGLEPVHTAVIAYDQATIDRSKSNWPVAGTYQSGTITMEYVLVTNQNVTFSGPNDGFNNELGAMPHLSCCCQTMTGLRTEYGDPSQPAPSKASAFFTVDRGAFFTEPEPPEPDTPITSVVALQDPQPLTITGMNPIGASYQLTLNFPTSVVIAYAPLDHLKGIMPMDSTPDFLAYYNMGDLSATCRALPKNPPPNACAPVSVPCRTPVGTQRAAKAAAPKPTQSKKVQDLIALGRKRSKDIPMITDMNCSNSSWP
jgi:hypothetical protein